MSSNLQTSNVCETYLKVKNIIQTNILEKVSLGYFMLNIKEKSFTYKKNNQSAIIISKHIGSDILNFIPNIDLIDTGICDYPIGFQIITKQRSFILFANSRIIYNRWIDFLKIFFKDINEKTVTFTPEKSNNNDIISNKKQNAKSPIQSKTNLIMSDYKNNNINTISKIEIIKPETDSSKKSNAKVLTKSVNSSSHNNFNISNNIINNNNVNISLNMSKNIFRNVLEINNLKQTNTTHKQDSKSAVKDNKHKIEENNKKNKNLLTLNNDKKVLFTKENDEWDNDYNNIILTTISNNVKNKKSSELKYEINKTSSNLNNISTIMNTCQNIKGDYKYKKDLMFEDPSSLHLRHSVNETSYLVENLHTGIDISMNKSIDMPSNLKTIKQKNKTSVNDVKIYSVDIKKKIIQNDDNSWTFSITVPVKNNIKK